LIPGAKGRKKISKASSVMSRPVLFVDSGIGGLPYLAMAKACLPREHFAYIADRAHFPYGTKQTGEIREAIVRVVLKAIDVLEPKVIVLACNTATMVAIDDLRTRLSVPVVGVVPAVKPAALLTANGRIGVMASGRAVQDPYLRDLINSYAADCSVHLIPADEVIRFVERQYVFSSREQTLDLIRRAIAPIRAEDIDTLVLACTHFLIMEKEFCQVLQEDIRVVDSREGVVKQLIRVMGDNGLFHETGGPHVFYVTGDGKPEPRYEIISKRYGLELAGNLRLKD
jgi:glutamate racemase